MSETPVTVCRHRLGRREDRSCGKFARPWRKLAASCRTMGHPVRETVIVNLRMQRRRHAAWPTEAAGELRALPAA